MIRKTLFTTFSLIAGLGALCSLNAQLVFQDDFTGADFGPEWQTYLESGGTEGRDFTLSGGLAFVTPTNSGGDSYKVFEGFSLDEPWSVSADMVGQNNNRWGGLVFNLDPATGNYHSFIVRVAGSQASAAQFRSYSTWGHLGSPITELPLTQELTNGEFFRYTVSSDNPGVYVLTIQTLDQDTREVTGTMLTMNVDTNALGNHPTYTGGFSGLHVNSNQVAFDNFEVTAVPEPATVAFLLGAGMLLLALARRRFRR